MNNVGIVKATKCPTCKGKIDAATGVAEPNHSPREGDFSLCFECGEILVFTKDLSLRMADLNDMLTVSDRNKDLLERGQQWIRANRPAEKRGKQ